MPLTITEKGSGKVSYQNITVDVQKDTTVSYVYELAFTPNSATTSINVSTGTVVVDEWCMSYPNGVTGPATIKNDSAAKFEITVAKPEGASEFKYTVTATNFTADKGVIGSEVTGATADATIELQLNSVQAAQPSITASITATKVALNQTISAEAGNGILAVQKNSTTELNYDTASQNVAVRVVLDSASTDTNDLIAVNYTVNGVKQAEVTESSVASTQDYSIDLPVAQNDTKGAVNVVVTSVELRKPVTTTSVVDVTAAGNMTTSATVKVLDQDGKTVSSGAKLAVGTQLTIEVTTGEIKADSKGVIFTFNSVDSKAVTTSGEKVTFTYTVVDVANSLTAVSVKDAT